VNLVDRFYASCCTRVGANDVPATKNLNGKIAEGSRDPGLPQHPRQVPVDHSRRLHFSSDGARDHCQRFVHATKLIEFDDVGGAGHYQILRKRMRERNGEKNQQERTKRSHAQKATIERWLAG
jgi:hypothetical protein